MRVIVPKSSIEKRYARRGYEITSTPLNTTVVYNARKNGEYLLESNVVGRSAFRDALMKLTGANLLTRLFVSFSGGRTSAMMVELILAKYAGQFEQIVILFSNTSQEHEDTLRFVRDCGEHWWKTYGHKVVWVEAVVVHGKGKGTKHRVVDFDTASRDGSVFEKVIAKYGLPNRGFPHCTRELKTQPMTSYVREVLGWKKGTYTTAIGIRTDEIDRMNPKFEEKNYWYPLVAEGVDKAKVNQHWRGRPFGLTLQSHLGNCLWCWKKTLRKHLTIIKDYPEVYDFPERMEIDHKLAGAGDGERKMFPQYLTVPELRAKAREPFEPFVDDTVYSEVNELDKNGGCKESCEAFGDD